MPSEFFERAQQVPDSGEYIYLSIPAADLGQRVFSDIDDLSYFRAPTSGEFEQDTRVRMSSCGRVPAWALSYLAEGF